MSALYLRTETRNSLSALINITLVDHPRIDFSVHIQYSAPKMPHKGGALGSIIHWSTLINCFPVALAISINFGK
jgi:hypothetical protein